MKAFLRRNKSISIAVLLGLSLLGCTSLRPEPALPFPDPPRIKFFRDANQNQCLSPGDAAQLDKWLEKLQEFRQARERLLR